MPKRQCLGCGTLHYPDQPCHNCGAHGSPPSTRRWRKQRQWVLQRDDYTCQLCGQPADQVDHKVPTTKGGSDNASNLQALCRPCNNRKGGH